MYERALIASVLYDAVEKLFRNMIQFAIAQVFRILRLLIM